MRRCLGLAVLAAILCGTYSSMQAQEGQGCAFGRLIVNVRDGEGKLILGLRPTSFQATLDRDPMKVLSDRVRAASPRVILLLDLSGSINRSNHNLEIARYVAGHFLVNGNGLRIALVTFSSHIIETYDFVHSLRDMEQMLLHLEEGKGPTALYDSLIYTGGLFQKRELGDAIYVITDGGDNHSKSQWKDVQSELLKKGIRLFWFPLYDRYFRAEGEEQSKEELQHLVDATGGWTIKAGDLASPSGRKSFDNTETRIYDMMKNFYELEVGMPSAAEQYDSVELQVVDDRGKKRKGVEVRYPKRLPPCEAALEH